MSLDFTKTFKQIGDFTTNIKCVQTGRQNRIYQAIEIMKSAQPDDADWEKQASRKRPFLRAETRETLGNVHCPGNLPKNFCVLSVDGSHIDVDRHLSAQCALINIGGCVIKYGAQSHAYLFNTPTLYSNEQLYLTEKKSSVTEVPIEGAVLGLKRTIDEIKALEPLIIEQTPSDIPTLALLDGSLVLWGLSGRGYPDLVRDEIITRGLVPALDSLRAISKTQCLSLAAYVSLPRNREVVNTLRLYLCESGDAECSASCSGRSSPLAPCNMVNDLLDRDLFQSLLQPGQRSSLFSTNSSIVREYRDHNIFFFYIHTGNEIARVEIPEWVASNETLLSLTHVLILDQCERGLGYPVAISEAHQQAVITGRDRQRFRELVDMSLADRGLSTFTSEKSLSKRMAWL